MRVTPGAKKEYIKQMGEAAFDVYVREPAQKNMANRRVCALMAEQFNVEVGDVRIVSGHRARGKMLTIVGI